MKDKKAEFPKYQSKDLIIGNLESTVGIITLWTEKEEILKYINKNSFAVIGQLYSKEGINYLIRNCLANKRIRHLVMIGDDLSGSGDVLANLMSYGALEGRVVNSFYDLDPNIPGKAIDNFVEHVSLLDLREKITGEKLTMEDLNDCLDDYARVSGEPYGKPEYFPEPKVNFPKRYESEKTGFVVRGRFIGDVWIKLLSNIVRYGTHKPSSYSDDQVELLDLVTITNEPMEVTKRGRVSVNFREFYLFDKEHLDNYYDQIITPKPFENINYTYGQRLASHFGVNQIDSIIDELREEKFSRRALGFTWDVKLDYNSSHAPCLDLIQCNVQDDKLYLTAYIRSNDMVKAWPENAYGLRRLQYLIAEKIGIKMGSLITISCSAHIYESDLPVVRKLIKDYRRSIEDDCWDPRGNFVINITGDTIFLFLKDSHGVNVDVITGKNPEDITKKLIDSDVILEPSHCLYLGIEIQKAYYCILRGEKYVQG